MERKQGLFSVINKIMDSFLGHINRYNPAVIRKAFRFLVSEFNYTIILDEESFYDNRAYSFVIEYAGNERRVRLTYDYKEDFFYFLLIRGSNTKYPNDSDHENIVAFWKVFKSFEPSLELKTLQPDNQTPAKAALVNAQLLQKYCSSILRGEKWI